MAFAAVNTRDTQIATMNITPLVDVMLVLLVIFMIAMPAVSQTLAIDLPGRAPPGKVINKQTLHLQISAGDLYTLDGTALGRHDLERRFDRAARGASLPLVVEVQISPEAEYESVALGLAAARNAGIANLSFVER